jgi:homocysteine S-methyltransferase
MIDGISFQELLENSTVPILADGAMGTSLHGKGLGFDTCFDQLNITNKEIIQEIHQAYIQAGSQVIFTNTFGANKCKLAEYGLGDNVTEINSAGVKLAQQVVKASGMEVFIAGDIGPLGVRITPYGRVNHKRAKEVFSEQIVSLCETGVDGLVLETFDDANEIAIAVETAREICQLPIIASVTFTRDDRTVLGDSPDQVAYKLLESGADLIGANCSGGPAQLYRVIKVMMRASPEAKYIVKPNAGWPEQIGGRIMYSADSD